MCHCDFNCECECQCGCVKSFSGVYQGSGNVYFVSLETGNTVVEVQDILLEIKKIANEIYYITFVELSPNPGTTFSCVATQSSENKYFIQSSTSGLNNFYFNKDEGFDILNVNFNTPNINNECFAASIKFYRK